jgi:hypothetical protein
MTDEELFERMVEVAAECDRREDDCASAAAPPGGVTSRDLGRMAVLYGAAGDALFNLANSGLHYGRIESFEPGRWAELKQGVREAAGV